MTRQRIRIVIPSTATSQEDLKLAREERNSVQLFFDTTGFDFGSNTLAFVFLRGQYSAREGTLRMAGVFVNGSAYPLGGLYGCLTLNCRSADITVPEIRLNLPTDFTGVLLPFDGLLIHIEVPAGPLNEDIMLSGSDMEGLLTDVEIFPVNGIERQPSFL